ncbi:MAG: RuBisCO accumulation factor 1 [Oscillatoria sp. PMC 1068.18]|nr:RuBisCO accumulation factor 1 [Oscillatoria sp. PMC 1076.18]MEC4989494.1 RuBisCO accumulation factor 1 [Oscillatoria sp. PMC 1068.18]
MNQNSQNTQSQLSETEALQLLTSLRRKEGSWVQWGQSCRKLQKAGYNSQTLFEETGIEPVQQNQIIVAAQVYESIIQAGASEEIKNYFQGAKSDILYEFRILYGKQRLAAAELAQEKQIDVDGAHEVARAIKDFSRYTNNLPAGFTNHPGDAVAYQSWKLARAKKDIQDRSRLIAKGLQFAHSASAREQIEKLLTDFSIVPTRKAPLLPVYRQENESELARIVPIAGTLPLSVQEIEIVQPLEEIEPFRIVQYSGNGAALALPGWQAILKAIDPVAILCQSEQLPNTSSNKSEAVVAVVDRQATEWNVNSYFLVANEDNVEIQWFEESPETPILGQLLLVLRAKKILDENNIVEPWQMDD